jgi:glycosyltransferase involved in cell wall biosynthesis
MGAGKPILLGVPGESATILKKAEAGLVFEPENVHSFLAAIDTMVKDPEKFVAAGANGKRYVAEHYNRGILAGRLWDALKAISDRHQRTRA